MNIYDYLLLRRCDHSIIRNVKMISGTCISALVTGTRKETFWYQLPGCPGKWVLKEHRHCYQAR